MSDLSSIVVVSGLPRSGTSILMQMLAAGGMPLLVDDTRAADIDNPRGYFEYSPVKQVRVYGNNTSQNNNWPDQALGKTVKVVSPLLANLPCGYTYWILLIERSLNEVIASQRAMLERTGVEGSTLSDKSLEMAFKLQQIELEKLLSTRGDFRILRVPHQQLIQDPASIASEITAFLAQAMPHLRTDKEAMARIVEPSLYRRRRPLDSHM